MSAHAHARDALLFLSRIDPVITGTAAQLNTVLTGIDADMIAASYSAQRRANVLVFLRAVAAHLKQQRAQQ